MRLLQVSVRSLLLYSIILVLISIPVSIFSIQALLNEEVDESLSLQAGQFLHHIKNFEYLGDLETDLQVLDQLSYNIHIKAAESQPIARKFETVFVTDSIEHDQNPFRQLSSSVVIKGKHYILTVQMSLVDNNDLVMAIGLVQVALSVLLAAGLLFMNRSLSRRLWKPFYNTLDRLKAYQLDKSEPVTLQETAINEFNDLNKTVNHLIERNRKVYLDQTEFIENASHELQTPIAIFQGKLDTLMQSPLSQAEAEIIQELESTIQRMARLNKNLLLLSKIDNDQFIDKEKIELSKVVTIQLNTLKPFAQLGNINFKSTINPVSIVANRALLEVLLTNLFHNAIRYSPRDKDIQVTLRDSTLSITNAGPPLNMDLEKMTERFSKGSSDTNSTGLGLAIVKKICDSCNYQLQYAYRNEAHTFSVTF